MIWSTVRRPLRILHHDDERVIRRIMQREVNRRWAEPQLQAELAVDLDLTVIEAVSGGDLADRRQCRRQLDDERLWPLPASRVGRPDPVQHTHHADTGTNLFNLHGVDTQPGHDVLQPGPSDLLGRMRIRTDADVSRTIDPHLPPWVSYPPLNAAESSRPDQTMIKITPSGGDRSSLRVNPSNRAATAPRRLPSGFGAGSPCSLKITLDNAVHTKIS